MIHAFLDSISNIYYNSAIGAQIGTRIGGAVGAIGFSVFGAMEAPKDPNITWKEVYLMAPFCGMALGSMMGGIAGMAAGAAHGIYKNLRDSLIFSFLTATI
ncbi:MAG: hypothetical protein K1X28_06110 [Parachlamydiales bacterium]|nr:hypothetical protein [Parachlamydiales bacterium]